MYIPRDNKSHTQKESGPKVLLFPESFLSDTPQRDRMSNDTHYEIIGIDCYNRTHKTKSF